MMEIGEHKFSRITIDYEKTGSELKKVRELKKMSIPLVARHVGKSTQLIYDWEKGSSRIGLDDFVRICGLYKIRPEMVMCKKKETGVYYDYDE